MNKNTNDIPLPFSFHNAADSEHCMKCGKPVAPEKGCEIHVHEGGSVIIRADDDASGRDDTADLGLWVLGPECQRHVPKEYRRPRALTDQRVWKELGKCTAQSQATLATYLNANEDEVGACLRRLKKAGRVQMRVRKNGHVVWNVC